MTKRLDVMFNARFPEGLCAFVREEAKRQGVSASEYVRRAIERAIPDELRGDECRVTLRRDESGQLGGSFDIREAAHAF